MDINNVFKDYWDLSKTKTDWADVYSIQGVIVHDPTQCYIPKRRWNIWRNYLYIANFPHMITEW